MIVDGSLLMGSTAAALVVVLLVLLLPWHMMVVVADKLTKQVLPLLLLPSKGRHGLHSLLNTLNNIPTQSIQMKLIWEGVLNL